jgi:hypothetical protein
MEGRSDQTLTKCQLLPGRINLSPRMLQVYEPRHNSYLYVASPA